jgi:quinol monooxygenase YgiN
MLIVIVDFEVAPQDRADTLATLAAERRDVRSLPGNLDYSVWTDPDEDGRLRLMHGWQDLPSFDAYKLTDGFKAVGAALFPKMVGKPTTQVHVVVPS